MENWQENIISSSDEKVKGLLAQTRTIAVIGMKGETYKPSYYVPKYMKDQGYEIIPINPKESEIDGMKCYKELQDLPQPVDIVQVFRRSQDVMPHAQEALAAKPKAFWMQTGIINREAAELLAKAGILVVMDRCMYVDHREMF